MGVVLDIKEGMPQCMLKIPNHHVEMELFDVMSVVSQSQEMALTLSQMHVNRCKFWI